MKKNRKRVISFCIACIIMLTFLCPVNTVKAYGSLTYGNTMSDTKSTDTLQETTASQTAVSETSVTNVSNTSDSEETTSQNEATEQEKTSTNAAATTERKAVWISFVDLGIGKKTKSQYTKKVTTMMKNVKSMGMNTVVFQVRPFSDALYSSDYFPWSTVVSKKQGTDPGYDPLEIAVEQAHKRNLKIEAWLNPYRVTTASTNIRKLSKDNPAREWYSSRSTRRNVLKYNGQLYYNPAKAEVRELIVNGVREIVENYDVDGIHFDDYFYPTFTKSNYKKTFDAKEYNAYVKKQKKAGESYLSIANWRRNNVNLLVKEVYKTIKQKDSKIEFGISPAGNIDNLKSNYSYYVDIDRWVSKSGYVDYVCPQIYWGFKNGAYLYDKVLKRWTNLCKNSKVKLYIGLAMYRTSQYASSEWRTSKTIMQRSVRYARNTKKTAGFYFFSYKSFYHSKAVKEKNNLLKELKKKQ